MSANAYDAAALDAQRGFFARALGQLPRRSHGNGVPHQQTVLAAELLHHTGKIQAAKKEANKILAAQGVPRALTSRCLVVVGMCALEAGELRHGIGLLRKAVRACQDTRDTEARCHAMLCLLAGSSDVSTSGSLASLTLDIRQLASQLGLTTHSIRLHLILGRAAGRHGQIEQAGNHLLAARRVLDSETNPWLEGRCFLDTSIVACLRSDHEDALVSAKRALACALKSGHQKTHAETLGHLGSLHLNEGNVSKADHFFIRCSRIESKDTEVVSALLDGRAQLELFRGRYRECEALLDKLDAQRSIASGFKAAWYQVSPIRTRVRLLQQTKRWSASLKAAEVGLAYAAERGDRLLAAALHLHKADALIGLNRLDEAASVVEGVSELCESWLPSMTAEVNRVKGTLLAKQGMTAGGLQRLQRAVRVLSVVGSASALRQAKDAVERAQATSAGALSDGRLDRGLVDAATILELPGNPELLGREALALIDGLDCAEGAALVMTSNGRPLTVLAHRQWTVNQTLQITRATHRGRRLAVGESRGHRYYLIAKAKNNVASGDTLAAIRTLIQTAVNMENHRREQRRQAAFSPFGVTDNSNGIFSSEQMLTLVAEARRVAGLDVPVLITGETGTGKEVVARMIHAVSHRASRSFVAFNCRNLTYGDAESQLFGHRRGSFTDAHEDTPGVIRGASGGTLMLDEVGELDPGIQPELLRFLESGRIQPVGEPKPVSANVRIIAATTVAIEALIEKGRFREDLFHRLNVVRLSVPALRHRRNEIGPLARHFLRRHAENLQRGHLMLSDEALSCLMRYDWPGNVRQLENELGRVAALADPDEKITRSHLSAEIRAVSNKPRDTASSSKPSSPGYNELTIHIDQPLSAAIEQLERAMIQRALREADGRVNAAAQMLGLSRKGLFLKRRRLGIETRW